MKQRSIILILLALAVAGGGLGALAFNHGPLEKGKIPPASPAKSQSREVDGSAGNKESPKRKIDPTTQKLADELIDFAKDWHALRPEKEDREARDRAWAAAAFAKLCELETEQLLALASMPMELRWDESMGESFEIPAFFAYFGSGFLSDNPLLQALGAKDYETARDFFLANHGLIDCAYTSTDDPNCTMAMEGLRAGVLRKDPAAGWKLYLEYLQTSKAGLEEGNLIGPSPLEEARKLIEIHTFCDSKGAWEFMLQPQSAGILKPLLTGYLNVAPERNWEPMVREFRERLRQTPLEEDRPIYRLLAAGWAEQDPREALAWYFAATREIPLPNDEDATDAAAAETREILSTIPRLPEAVERMAREGCSDLAELVITAHPTDVRLLDAVPLLPSADSRAVILEQATQAMLEKVGPYKACWDQDHVDLAIAGLRRAAAQSELSPELMERVDAGIRALEEKKSQARKRR